MAPKLPAMVLGVMLIQSLWVATAAAQEGVDQQAAEIEQLAAGPAAQITPRELERARELLRLAREANDADQAQTLMAVLPLQVRLIRELLRAAQLEAEASEVEARQLELDQAARVEREALEQVLERLLAILRARRLVEP